MNQQSKKRQQEMARMKWDIEQLPPLPYPTSTDARPRSSGTFITRAKDNVENCNYLTQMHRSFLLKYMTSSEESIMNEKYRLAGADVERFVSSFIHTLLSRRKGGINCFCVLQIGFIPTNLELIQFWTLQSSKFCHIPVRIGKGRGSHLIGVSMAMKQRKIYVYDSHKLYGKSKVTCPNIIIEVDSDTFHGTDASLFGHGSNTTKGEKFHVLEQLYDTLLEVEEACDSNPHNLSWRICLVNSFMYQENEVDCGAFVCFFFECLSRKINLNVGTGDRGFILNDYREFIAYSCCVHRIQLKINRNRGGVGYRIGKEAATRVTQKK